MSCNPLTDPACIITKVIPPVTGTVTGGILAGIAQAMNEGIRWIVVNTATWWVQIPSPDLTAEPAVARIQAWLLPITLAIGAAVTLGVIVPALLLKAGDAWSSWVLQASTGGHFTQRLTGMLQLGGNAAPAVVLILGLVAIVLALAQAVLMLFRQVALVILAGVLPLAAAGTVAPLTRPWIRKVSSWTLALICYKPAAAAVYAAAFTMFGSGRGTRTVLMGFVTMLLSLVALPALMKFFTWTTGSIAESGGGQLLGTAALGAVAVGALRSGSAGGSASAARDQAAYMNSRLGPPPAGSAPPDPGNPAAPGGSGGPAGAPAPSGSAAAQPASAFPAAAAPPPPGGVPAGATASAPAFGSPAPGGTPAGAAPASGGGATAATGAAQASAGPGTAARATSGTAAGAAAAPGPAGLAAAAAAQAAQAAADTA